jgi:hypothetical protein
MNFVNALVTMELREFARRVWADSSLMSMEIATEVVAMADRAAHSIGATGRVPADLVGEHFGVGRGMGLHLITTARAVVARGAVCPACGGSGRMPAGTSPNSP